MGASTGGQEALPILKAALQQLERYLARAPLATYDVFDYMALPWVSALFLRRAHGSRLAGLALKPLQGALLLAPLATRRLLGVRPGVMSGALAFYAQGLCDAYAYDGNPARLARAGELLEQLWAMHEGPEAAPTWGFPFAWPRDTLVPANTPIAYTTAVCGEAYLAYAQAGGGAVALERARAAGQALLTRFNITEHNANSASIGYTTLDTSAAVNVSAHCAMFLLRLEPAPGSPPRELALKLLRFTLERQWSGGGWPYSTGETFCDNSHSAMVLQALAEAYPLLEPGPLQDLTAAGLRLGLQHFMHNLFNTAGMPRMDCRREYPLDIASVAESCAAFAAVWRQRGLLDAAQVARLAQLWPATMLWGVKLLQGRDGCFAARYYPPLRMQVRSLRWGNAQALRALALTLNWLAEQG